LVLYARMQFIVAFPVIYILKILWTYKPQELKVSFYCHKLFVITQAIHNSFGNIFSSNLEHFGQKNKNRHSKIGIPVGRFQSPESSWIQKLSEPIIRLRIN